MLVGSVVMFIFLSFAMYKMALKIGPGHYGHFKGGRITFSKPASRLTATY